MTATLQKAFLVLGAVAAGPLTASQAAALTGLNRSTVYRICLDLEQNRFIVRDLVGRFAIGPMLAELTMLKPSDGLQAHTDAVLADLQSKTGAEALLFWADGAERVCIGVGSLSDTTWVGMRLAVSLCASSMVLLAWSAARRVAARHLQIAASQYQAVRRQGWASSVSEVGVGVVSAPVRDSTGDVIGSVAIQNVNFAAAHHNASVLAPLVVAAGNQLTEAIVRTAKHPG